ncbi:hypothetical protein CLU79DRAFT_840460 [Phycomyces nitens]|nr:hypothetical protein CLU79DRAFT_840460 [Phycomyces nitens]
MATDKTDQFNKAVAMTTDIPLPCETAIPAPRRKRNNSIIPLEFLNDTSEGGRERAALATVFGVKDYADSKIFWERPSNEPLTGSQQDHKPAQEPHVIRTSPDTPSTSTNERWSIDRDTSQQTFTSLVDSVLDPVGTNALKNGLKPFLSGDPPTPEPMPRKLTLPDIPSVCHFQDDLFSTSSLHSTATIATPNTASTTTIIPSTPLRSISSPTYANNTFNTRVPTSKIEPWEVAPPLVFIGYPPAIFDLLRSDEDDRIIIWGPDPQALSMRSRPSPSSTLSTQSIRSITSSSSTTTPSRGFSSNTTSTTENIDHISNPNGRSKKSMLGPTRWPAQMLSDGLKFSKSIQLKRPRPHSVISSFLAKDSTEGDHRGSVLLRKALGKKPIRKEPEEQAVQDAPIPQVIEAATVEKLVQKLTSTLDYNFMTDFFLTYRTFISPTQLCKLLILRFEWALLNDEEDRRVVRIRDQRIVKGLKRVVRRLKKVYYRSSASERVQVIAPPPPTSDQERVGEMVRAKLSQSAIRRKTTFGGVDVGGQHNGNMAVQDARRAPVVVIGSVRNPQSATGSHPESEGYRASTTSSAWDSDANYNNISRYASSAFSMARTGQSKMDVMAIKASYMHRMEQQKRFLDEDGSAPVDPPEPVAPEESSRSSVVTDDSLESTISPGTTDAEMSEEDSLAEEDVEDEVDRPKSVATATSERHNPTHFNDLNEQLTAKLESERRRREEEDERKRAEFFSGNPSVEPQGPSPSVSRMGSSSSMRHPEPPTASPRPTPAPTTNVLTTNVPTTNVPTTTAPQSPVPLIDTLQTRLQAFKSEGQPQESPSPIIPVKKGLVASRMAAFENIPSQSTSLFNRRPSAGRRVAPNKIPSPQNEEKETLFESWPVEGLAKNLSKKSIEKRKSERQLNEKIDSQSAQPLSTNQKPTKSKSLKATSIESFKAIAYDQTCADHPAPSLTPTPLNDKQIDLNGKRGLAKTIAKVFSPSDQPLIISTQPDITPPTQLQTQPQQQQQPQEPIPEPIKPQQTGIRKKKSNPGIPAGQMVIRIAEALRQDSKCECTTCTRIPGRTQECKRISLVLHPEGDDERRHSMELRRRRGASFDRGPVFEPVPAPKEPMPAMEKRDGPLYLSYLRPFSSIHPSDQPNGMLRIPEGDHPVVFSASTTSSTINHTGSFDHHEGTSVAATQNSCVTDASVFIAEQPPVHPTQPSSASAPSGRYAKSPSAMSIPAIPRPVHSLGTSMISHERIETNWAYRSFILKRRSEDMAQQLCLIEKTVLLDVNWEEMVHCKWTKMDATKGDFGPVDEDEDEWIGQNNDINYTRRTRQIQLTRKDHGGVEQVIKRFNAVCLWVASEIVRTRQIDERVRVIEKFIRLAQKCKLFCNFATLVQILLGLQSPSVSRLQKTWSRVGTSEMKLLDQLSAFTSPMRNWKSIRDSMMMVAEEYGMSPTEVQIEMPGTHNGASKTKIKLPFGGCIPFLGIYLSDLVFNSEQPAYIEPDRENHKIYQANTQNTPISPVLKQSLVNFRKHRIIATVIKRVLTFQNLARRYSFEPDETLYELCFQVNALTTEKIRELSLEIEPA